MHSSLGLGRFGGLADFYWLCPLGHVFETSYARRMPMGGWYLWCDWENERFLGVKGA